MPADLIDNFRGRWAFLSNFHPAPLVWEGETYPTSEHAFNAGKTLDAAERAHVRESRSAADAKRRGRHVNLRPGWDTRVRFEVMASVLDAKFRTHPGRVEALLSTGDAMLVEGNTWHDNVWGDCRCGRRRCEPAGDNHLGRLLMLLRDELAGGVR